jgi:hypothetical protein
MAGNEHLDETWKLYVVLWVPGPARQKLRPSKVSGRLT